MIKTEDIKKIVKLVLLTGYVKNCKPLSLLLVADAGLGKTEIISSYKSQRLIFATDLTYMGLLKELKKKNVKKHLIIPDFIKITQKKRSTSDNFISLLNALTEEGLGLISMPNFEHDYKGRQMGIITATTKASLNQKFKSWKSIGFVSRMLLCSYSYSPETIKEIFNYINSEDFLKNEKRTFLKGYKDTYVQTETELNQQLNKLSKKQFRTQKQLQALAKAHAILRGDTKTRQEDIDEVFRLSKYLNLNYVEL